MATRKIIKSKQQSTAALELEKSGDIPGAIKLYQKAAATDPLNQQAWNRQMILYRKTKSRPEEIALIRSAIAAYKVQTMAGQQDWLKENQEKAESTRELAQVLGLLEENGLPASDNTTIEKWETRLYLLEYRLNNARKKKPTQKKPKKTTVVPNKAKISPAKAAAKQKAALKPNIKPAASTKRSK